MKTVLFACVHNAGRSQMAAGFFNAVADPMKARGVSAGTEPALRVHPDVLEVMNEMGVDLAGAKPQRLTDELAAGVQVLVTMGCGEQCPAVSGVRRVECNIRDPKGQPLDDIRTTRESIRERVHRLAGELGVLRPRSAGVDEG
jgi:arsenate reductase (thioredoxin)